MARGYRRQVVHAQAWKPIVAADLLSLSPMGRGRAEGLRCADNTAGIHKHGLQPHSNITPIMVIPAQYASE